MARKHLVAAAAAAALLAPRVALAQVPTAATTPLGGTEWSTCYQSSSPKACRTLDIAKTLLSVADTWTATQTFSAGISTVSITGMTTPLSVGQGGTGQQSLTAHGVIIGEGAAGLSVVGPCATGQILAGMGSNDPSCKTISGDASLNSSNGALTVTKFNGTPFGTAAGYNIGTSGGNIPLENAANTWSGTQTYNQATINLIRAPMGIIDPVQDYGCVGDGVADDTTCLGNAITAVETSGKLLWLGPHKYLSAGGYTDSAGPLMIQGIGGAWIGNKSSGIIAKNASTTLFTLSGSGDYIKGTYLKAAANPTGALIATVGTVGGVGGSTSIRFEDDWIDSPCIGLDLNGNSISVNFVYVGNVAGAGCMGVRVGHGTITSLTTDVRITNSTIQGDPTLVNRPDYDLRVEDAGGLYLANDDFLYGKIGTSFCPGGTGSPGQGQWVAWPFISNTVLGDTTLNQALLIDTCGAGGLVSGAQFEGAWMASQKSTSSEEVTIQDTGGGAVYDLYFVGARVFDTAGQDAIHLKSGVSDVSFDASHICGFGTVANGGTGIAIDAGVGQVAIRNNLVGNNCAGDSGQGTVGVGLAGSNAGITITGNDFVGVDSAKPIATPISGTPTGSSVVANNVGVDTAPGSVASAATITLGPNPVWLVTGSTNVSTINGFWSGRQVTLVTPAASLTFSGGNICTAVTSTINMPIQATYLPGSSCWSLLTRANTFTGDTGSGGSKGLVPGPNAGDAAAGKFLGASANWLVPPTFTGDSGSGGKVGYVPAPAAGDAAAGKYLGANGSWLVPPHEVCGSLSIVSLLPGSSGSGPSGLSVLPNHIMLKLTATAADTTTGYASGDVLFVPLGGNNTGNYGVATWAAGGSTSQINYLIGSGGIQVLNKSTGASALIDGSNATHFSASLVSCS